MIERYETTIRHLLNGIDEFTSESGRSPLIIAAIHGRTSEVKKLLAAGTIDTPDKWGYIALEYAIAYGHSSVIELLAPRDKAKNESLQIESIHVEHAMEINTFHKNKHNPENYLSLPLNFGEDARKDIENLIEDRSMLKRAALRGDNEVIKTLLERKTILPVDKNNALRIAVDRRRPRPQTAMLLLKEGGAVDMLDEDGSTTLEEAVISCHNANIIEMLLECEPATNENRGKAMLASLKHRRFHALAPLLKANAMKGLDKEELSQAVREALNPDHFEAACAIMEQLLKTNSLLPSEVRDKKDNTPVENKNIYEMIAVEVRDENGNTLLMKAAEDHRLNIISQLVKAGAIVDAQNKQGNTALTLAAREGKYYSSDVNAAVIKLLVEAGSTVSLQNEEGQTAWMLTQYQASKETLMKYREEEKKHFEENHLSYYQFKALQTPVVRKILTSILKGENDLPNVLISKETASLICDYLVPANPNEKKKIFSESPIFPFNEHDHTFRLFNKMPLLFLPHKAAVMAAFRREVSKLSFSTKWWHWWTPKEIESAMSWTRSKKQLDKLLSEGVRGNFGDCYREIFKKLLLIKSEKTNDNSPSTAVPQRPSKK